MHDPLWMRVLLMVHIAGGFAAFVLAPVALASAKGGRTHRRWGMVYLWAMGVVAATALPMALYRPVLFLALVAVFSFYFAFSGYRVLKLKDLHRGGKARPVDWFAAAGTLVSSLALLLLGVFKPHAVQNMQIVSIVFGVIGVRVGLSSMWLFTHKPKEKMFWWYTHLGNFIGSYIAAWSAFSAVTLTQFMGNHWYVWLWPTIVGAPAIALTTAYYKRKFAPRAEVARVAA